MASTPLIARRSPRNALGGAVSHSHLFHVHFPDANGSSTATGDSDAGVFLAQTLSKVGSRDGAGGMGDRMSPSLSKWTGNTFSVAYQLGTPDQVGMPSTDVAGGSSVGASSRLLRSLA